MIAPSTGSSNTTCLVEPCSRPVARVVADLHRQRRSGGHPASRSRFPGQRTGRPGTGRGRRGAISREQDGCGHTGPHHDHAGEHEPPRSPTAGRMLSQVLSGQDDGLDRPASARGGRRRSTAHQADVTVRVGSGAYVHPSWKAQPAISSTGRCFAKDYGPEPRCTHRLLVEDLVGAAQPPAQFDRHLVHDRRHGPLE